MPGSGRSDGVDGASGTGADTDPRPTATAGWYPDPAGRAPQRHWSGQAWTSWLCAGAHVWSDPVWARRSAGRGDLDALRFVEEVFLREAHARAELTAPQVTALLTLVADLTTQARADADLVPSVAPVLALIDVPIVAPSPIPPVAAPRTERAPVSFASPRSCVSAPFVPAPYVPAPYAPTPATPAPPHPRYSASPAPVRPVPVPSPRAQWWSRARVSIGSDLAVHGLAYLGVLLLFVGMFGLVAFAFSEVTPSLRPVAELACAAVPFAAARVLRRHGAEVVGGALEIVGGLLVPLMLTASVVDGFGLPPDQSGAALVGLLTVLGLGTAAAYAAWVHAHPGSGLRFLVGPVLWYSAAMATLGVGRAVPTGEGVAVPTVAQAAAMTAALVLTAAVARYRPRMSLAGPALTAAVPGTVVLAVLVLLTGAAQGWPPLPVALAGIGILAAIELQRVRLPSRVLDAALPGWWAVNAIVLVAGSPDGGGAALSAAVFLALIEVAGRHGRSNGALAAPAVGLAACLLAITSDPWWAFGAFTVVTAWVVARRVHPFRPPATAGAFDLAAAVLPAAAVLTLTAATNGTVGLLAATVVTTLATVPATRPVLRRGPGDLFWRRWWVGALVAVAAGAQIADLADGATDAARWNVVGVVAVLAVLGAVGPLAPIGRPWVVTALTAWAWILACELAGLPGAVRAGVLALAGLGLVVAAHLAWPTAAARSRPSFPAVRASLGLTGHSLTLVALALALAPVVAGQGAGMVVAIAAATAGLVVTGARDDRDRSPVGAALARVAGSLRYLPWVLACLGGVGTVSLALDVAGLVALTDPWAPAVLAGAAVGYAAVARASSADRRAATATWAGFTAGLLAVATAGAAWPEVVALSAVIVSVALVPSARRVAVMRWAAWAAVAPWAGLLAARCVPPFAALEPATAVALTLIAVGGALVVGAGATDLRGRPWEPRWAPARRGAVPPLVLGVLEVGIGLLITGVLPSSAGGRLTLAVALIVLATGALARAGSLGGVAATLAWVSVVRLATGQIAERPWISVLAAVGLLVAAEALHRLTRDRVWWVRWDVPLLLAAAPVALTALVAAADGDATTATFVVVGLLTVAVALRLHAVAGVADAVGFAGTVTILLGAAQAGGGWLALSLLALSAAHTALAVRASPVVRVVRLVAAAAAAVACWGAALAWFGWTAQVDVDLTAVAGGAGLLVAAVVARSRGRGGAFVWTWGVTAGLVAAGAGVASLGLPGVAPSVAVVVAALAVAAALSVAASPLRAAGLRDAAAVALLTGVLIGLAVAGVSSAVRVGALAALGGSISVALLAGAGRVPSARWARPAAELGAMAWVSAILLGLSQLPGAVILVPGLAAAAVWFVAVGVAWRQVWLQMMAPALACVAWFAFVADAVGGRASWYTLPIGIALLATVALWRRDRRAHGLDLAGTPVVVLEITGVAFGVGASLVQAITETVADGLVAAGFGIAVVVWGLMTRVRRRVAIGAVVVVTAMVVLVVVPLVALLPAWGGAGLWIMVAAVGLVAVLAATMLEKAREAARSTRQRWSDLTTDWE